MKIKMKNLIIFLLSIIFLFLAYNLINDYSLNFIVIREFYWSQHTYDHRFFKTLEYPSGTFEKEAYQILSKFDSDFKFLEYIKAYKIDCETFRPSISINIFSNEKEYEFIAQKFMEAKVKSLNLCSTILESKITDTPTKFSIEFSLNHYNGSGTHWFAIYIYKKIRLILWDRCKCL
jgi:hypothetical protein